MAALSCRVRPSKILGCQQTFTCFSAVILFAILYRISLMSHSRYQANHFNNESNRNEWMRGLERGTKRIEWFHAEKTGSSFGDLLVKFACPELGKEILVTMAGVKVSRPCLQRFVPYEELFDKRDYLGGEAAIKLWPIGAHYPLVNRTDVELSHIFTMLRLSQTRTASEFHHGTDFHNVTATEDDICNYMSQIIPGGRQTYMVTGINLTRGSWNEDEITKEACRRVRLFEFVGITDFWVTSSCIFSQKYGVKDFDPYYHEKKSLLPTGKGIRKVDCPWDLDKQLMECVFNRFVEDLGRHKECIPTFYKELSKVEQLQEHK